MIQWHIENKKLKDLKPHPKNPRRLTKEQALHLEESLSKFGLIDLPIINTDCTVIGGHQRLNILKKQKVKEVDCWIPDRFLEPNEVEELLIRLNKNHGEFNYDDLANNFDVADLITWGFTLDDFQVLPVQDSEVVPQEKTQESQNICPTCGKKSKK